MHDPRTVAIEIFGPRGLYYKWLRHKSDKICGIPYVDPLVVIWHVDPEKDGSDDSCGFCFPPVTKEDIEWLKKESASEEPFFFGEHGTLSQASASEVVFSIWALIAWRRYRRGKLSAGEVERIFQMTTLSGHNLQYMVEDARGGNEGLFSLFACVFREYSRFHRPWFRHPRWHIHHWRVQIPILLDIKRFLFSRCHGCGKRFRWRESPTSFSWNSTGPRWFRSEVNVYHSACANKACQAAYVTNLGTTQAS